MEIRPCSFCFRSSRVSLPADSSNLLETSLCSQVSGMPCGPEGPACSGKEYFLDANSIFSGFSLPEGLCSSLTFDSIENMDNSLMHKTGRAVAAYSIFLKK